MSRLIPAESTCTLSGPTKQDLKLQSRRRSDSGFSSLPSQDPGFPLVASRQPRTGDSIGPISVQKHTAHGVTGLCSTGMALENAPKDTSTHFEEGRVAGQTLDERTRLIPGPEPRRQL
jgi:hypothetical protein